MNSKSVWVWVWFSISTSGHMYCASADVSEWFLSKSGKALYLARKKADEWSWVTICSKDLSRKSYFCKKQNSATFILKFFWAKQVTDYTVPNLISLIKVGPTLTDFQKFHPPQNKNPPSTFIDFLDFSTLHSSFITGMY